MAKRRYIEWDFDRSKATEYEREGECNGCGQCCIALIRFRVSQPRGRQSNNGGRLGAGAGIGGKWIEVKEGKRRRFLQMTGIESRPREDACPSLTPENTCGVHGQKNWKKDLLPLCDTWPLHPDHVTPFDQCSYKFNVIAEWDFNREDEDG